MNEEKRASDAQMFGPQGTCTRHLRPRRMLDAMHPEAKHRAETDKLNGYMQTIVHHAQQHRFPLARVGLQGVKDQMRAAATERAGVEVRPTQYADVAHDLHGRPRSPADAFQVAAQNVVRAYAAHDYALAARAVDGLLVRLRTLKARDGRGAQ